MSGAAGAAAATGTSGAGQAGGGAAAGGTAGAAAGQAGATGSQAASGGTGVASNTAAPASGTGATDWYSGIENPELRGYAQQKNWRNPSELVDSFRNLEKLRGIPHDQILAMPKTDDAIAMNALYDRMGRPPNPEGYGFKAEGETADFTNWISGEFHKAGLSATQAKALMDANATRLTSMKEAATRAQSTKAEGELTALKAEWGAAFDQNMAAADRALAQFGITDKTIKPLTEAVGGTAVLKFLQAVGKSLGESTFIPGATGRNPNAVLTPTEAKAAIREKMSDHSFREKLVAKDGAATAEWERLNKMASPELS